MYHSMSYLLEFLVWFYSWIFEKISVYGCDLMCLTELYRYTRVVFMYSSIYSVSSINYYIVRIRIATMMKIIYKYFIIFFFFLENMFRGEYISTNPIYCNEESPLSIWTFTTEECCIEDENRRGTLGKVRIETNMMMYFGYLYFLLKLWCEFSMYCFDGHSRIIC